MLLSYLHHLDLVYGYSFSHSIQNVRHAVQFLTQIMMYAAPVVWPLVIKEKFGESLAHAYSIYPMVGVIEGFRASILGLNQMPWDSICIGALSSVLIFISGLFYFKIGSIILLM